MICTMSKLAKVTISENSTVMAMMFRIIGSVMWRNFCHGIGAVDGGGLIRGCSGTD